MNPPCQKCSFGYKTFQLKNSLFICKKKMQWLDESDVQKIKKCSDFAPRS